MQFLLSIFLTYLALAAADASDPVLPAHTCPPKDITALLTSGSHVTCPLPNLDPEPTAQIPWSHKPRCTTASLRTYCVSTSSHFGSSGLSLIADPQAASSLAPILNGIYHSSFPSPASTRNFILEPAFEVQDIPGKGKGLVATRHIKAKETFLLDHAALVVQDSFAQDVIGEERRGLLNEATDRLVDPSAVTSLGTSGESGDVVEDILKTNNFKSELDIGRSSVLFPVISVRSSLPKTCFSLG